MTPKFKALLSAAIAALTGFASYIADMPNSTQDAIAGTLVSLFPVAYRGTVGGVLKAISMICVYTAVHYAAKSGPIAPPSVATPAQKSQESVL